MAVTRQELEDFKRFADARLSNGGSHSLRELVEQWEARCSYEDSVAEIRAAIPEIEAGHGRELDAADAEIREKLRFGRKAP